MKYKDTEINWVADRSAWERAHIQFKKEYFRDNPELSPAFYKLIDIKYNLKDIKGGKK